MKKKILCFFGTRPEAIKMAPVVKKLREENCFDVEVALSAQHRDMLDQVLELFSIKVDYDLNIMKKGQSLFHVTSKVLEKMETVLEKSKPDMVLVHGDTTTTMVGTMACFYKNIPVGHVEAGLRTNDLKRPFPEEMNRRVTDLLADLYFSPTPMSRRNLLVEKISDKKIFVTGNTVIDALLIVSKMNKPLRNLNAIRVMKKIGSSPFILVTAHRRENFGEPFKEAFSALKTLTEKFPHFHWVYPVHPNPNVSGMAQNILGGLSRFHLLEPLEYDDLVSMMKKSFFVLTDSGGLQEEAPSLGKPVLVLRNVTERPEAVKAGTVKLVGTNRNKIIREVSKLIKNPVFYKKMSQAVNPYGDGLASTRIISVLKTYFNLSNKKFGSFKGA
ncbi:MAG: non-hydrolyzing UDP-N-acetylglucosamine 2-epimerase [Elusimicrobiota bacterium]